MNKSFVLKHLLYMGPAIFIFLYFTLWGSYLPADWNFHITGIPLGDYPPLGPTLANVFYENEFFEIFCILMFIAIPYILLHMITKQDLAGLAYLYLSGIPYMLMWGGFVAQGLMHILMLLTVLHPVGFVFALITGPFVHREWGLSLILGTIASLVYHKEAIKRHIWGRSLDMG